MEVTTIRSWYADMPCGYMMYGAPSATLLLRAWMILITALLCGSNTPIEPQSAWSTPVPPMNVTNMYSLPLTLCQMMSSPTCCPWVSRQLTPLITAAPSALRDRPISARLHLGSRPVEYSRPVGL